MCTMTINDTKSKSKSRRPGWVRLTLGGLLLFTTGVVLTLFLSGDFRAFEVVGESMHPTFERGDRVIALRTDPGKIRRGDIVVVDLPAEQGQELIKRVVALPGDIIYLYNGVLYVNGNPEPLPSNAIPDPPTTLIPRTRLGKNAYFVLGDNRDISADSRHWGAIALDDIVARPRIVYFSRDPKGGVRWGRIGKLLGNTRPIKSRSDPNSLISQ